MGLNKHTRFCPLSSGHRCYGCHDTFRDYSTLKKHYASCAKVKLADGLNNGTSSEANEATTTTSSLSNGLVGSTSSAASLVNGASSGINDAVPRQQSLPGTQIKQQQQPPKTKPSLAPKSSPSSNPLSKITFVNAIPSSAKIHSEPVLTTTLAPSSSHNNKNNINNNNNPLSRITFVNAIIPAGAAAKSKLLSSSAAASSSASSTVVDATQLSSSSSFPPSSSSLQSSSSLPSSSSSALPSFDSAFRPIAASPAPSNASSASLGPYSRPSFDEDDELDDRFRPSPTPNAVSLSSYKNKTVYNRTASPLLEANNATAYAATPPPSTDGSNASGQRTDGDDSPNSGTSEPAAVPARFDYVNNSRFDVAGSKTYARKRKMPADFDSSCNESEGFDDSIPNIRSADTSMSEEEAASSANDSLERPVRSPSPLDRITRDDVSSSITLDVRVKADVPNETGVPSFTNSALGVGTTTSSTSAGTNNSALAGTSSSASSSSTMPAYFPTASGVPVNSTDSEDALLESVLGSDPLGGATSGGTATPTSAANALDEGLLHCTSEETDFLHQAAETLLSLTGSFPGEEEPVMNTGGIGTHVGTATSSSYVNEPGGAVAERDGPTGHSNTPLETNSGSFQPSSSGSFTTVGHPVDDFPEYRSHSNSPLDLSLKKEAVVDVTHHSSGPLVQHQPQQYQHVQPRPQPIQAVPQHPPAIQPRPSLMQQQQFQQLQQQQLNNQQSLPPQSMQAPATLQHHQQPQQTPLQQTPPPHQPSPSPQQQPPSEHQSAIDKGDALRRRFIVSPDEKRYVLAEYLRKTNNYEPSKEQMAELSRLSNVPEKKVNKWFQNKRSTTTFRRSKGLPPLPSATKSPPAKMKQKSAAASSLDERSNRVLQMLEQWYELQEFDRLPTGQGPTLAQLEAIGIQVGIPVKTAAEWYALRRQKSLLAAKRASENATTTTSAAGSSTSQSTHHAPQQQPPPPPHASQQQPQQKRVVKKNAPKEPPGWRGDSSGKKNGHARKPVLVQRQDDNATFQSRSENGHGGGKISGHMAQLEKWFVNHKSGFPSGKEIDRLMKMTNKSREFIVEWCKNRRRTKVEKMQTCLVSDIQTAILEHWFVSNRAAVVSQSVNVPMLTNRYSRKRAWELKLCLCFLFKGRLE